MPPQQNCVKSTFYILINTINSHCEMNFSTCILSGCLCYQWTGLGSVLHFKNSALTQQVLETQECKLLEGGRF